MPTLGEKIRIARKSRGLTSLDLALRLGVTQATISRLENDEYAQAPKPEIARGITEVLGIPQVVQLEAMGYEITLPSGELFTPTDPVRDAVIAVIDDDLRRLPHHPDVALYQAAAAHLTSFAAAIAYASDEDMRAVVTELGIAILDERGVYVSYHSPYSDLIETPIIIEPRKSIIVCSTV